MRLFFRRNRSSALASISLRVEQSNKLSNSVAASDAFAAISSFIYFCSLFFVCIHLSGPDFCLTTPTAPSSPTPPPHSRQILFCFLFNLVSPDAKAVDVVTMSAEGTMVALFVRWPGPRICFSLGSCGPPPKSTCEKN